MNPKLSNACVKCDGPLTSARGRREAFRPTRKSILLLIDGSTTNPITTCAGCVLEPDDMPGIWGRYTSLMAQGVRPTAQDREVLRRFERNVPMGVLYSWDREEKTA